MNSPRLRSIAQALCGVHRIAAHFPSLLVHIPRTMITDSHPYEHLRSSTFAIGDRVLANLTVLKLYLRNYGHVCNERP